MLEGTHGTAPHGATLGTRIDKYRTLIMPLVRRQKITTLVGSLVLIVKFGAQTLAAVAARNFE